MTIQWEPTRTFPYFYPVQILQFGFEHFTKNRSMAMANLPVKIKSLGGERQGEGNLRKGETGFGMKILQKFYFLRAICTLSQFANFIF